MKLQNIYNELKEFKAGLENPVFSSNDLQGEEVLIQITSKYGLRGSYRVALILDLGMEDTVAEIRSVLLRDIEKKMTTIENELKKENDK